MILNVPRRAVVVAAVIVTAAATSVGSAYALGAFTGNADCSPSPSVTYSDTAAHVDIGCDIPLPPPVTVTETVTVTPSTTTTVPTTTTTTVPTTTTTTVPTTTTTTTPPTQTLNCGPNPSACGYPDATNTGLTGPVTRAPCPTNGNVDNAVIENLDLVDCAFTITGKNVTVRNVRMRITATDRWALAIQGSGYAKISNVDIAGKSSGNGSVQYAIFEMGSGPTTVDKANLFNCMDCVVGEGIIVTNSYVHDMAYINGAHDDGLMCNAECGVTYRHNTVFNKWTSTAAISLFADFGTPRNSVIDDNLIAGGGYMVYGGNSNATGIKFTNNRFSRIFYPEGTNGGPGGGYWGVAAEWDSNNTGNVWSGNVWDDTGRSVSP